jgi:hypothetical protein
MRRNEIIKRGKKGYMGTKLFVFLYSWIFVSHPLVEPPPLPLLSCEM